MNQSRSHTPMVVGLPSGSDAQLSSLLSAAARVARARQLTIRLVHASRPRRELADRLDLEELDWLLAANAQVEHASNLLTSLGIAEDQIVGVAPDAGPAESLIDESRSASLIMLQRSARTPVERAVGVR